MPEDGFTNTMKFEIQRDFWSNLHLLGRNFETAERRLKNAGYWILTACFQTYTLMKTESYIETKIWCWRCCWDSMADVLGRVQFTNISFGLDGSIVSAVRKRAWRHTISNFHENARKCSGLSPTPKPVSNREGPGRNDSPFR